MANHRTSRLNEDIMRELCAILRTLKDPRISSMLSVVKVDVTNDLSYATCYVSALEGREATAQSVKGLRSAAGYVRRELGRSLELRHVPEVRFVADDSIEHSAHINQLLRDINAGGSQQDED
ncbi:MAG: 30S ribosome-binding factor RbfA [Ruminococcaceae bacterium]|nr:30S ribosome-binding factor RbfA [Oscillospiraceae bacterium]